MALCDSRWCDEDACYRLKPDDVPGVKKLVCADHVQWGKTELKDDFPGHKIKSKYID